MKSKFLPIYLIIIFTSFFLLLNKYVKQAFSVADHVVISEIQIAGSGDADDEFVELYNPTDLAVNLSGWRLNKSNSSGTVQNLVASMSGTIPPHGYFLIADPDYDGSVAEDLVYSATSSAITTNNTINLYSDAGTTIVEKAGFGTPFDAEGTAFPTNPVNDGSIERKAFSTSTSDSMTGSDANSGNGEDTDNNANDFVARTVSDPQNTSSAAEIPVPTPTPTPTLAPTETLTPSPSESPTPTPTETLTPTLTPSDTPTPTDTPPASTNTPTPTLTSTPVPTDTPTPTNTPTNTPIPTSTLTPTQIPTNTPIPTFTLTPTLTPTDIPTPTDSVPTQTPTETPVPTLTLTPTPTSEVTPTNTPTPSHTPFFRGRLFSCRVEYIKIDLRFFSIQFPKFHCVRI